MVGASMGGAAGMVFADNHLDPSGPMVAAAASVSGIQDCERRFHEQGWNNSMVAAFGGSPESVPFTYHRNSPICFADSTASMHRNARHLPLLLSFGHGETDSIWRSHAEDLYDEMAPFADHLVLHESSLDGHGWSGAEESFICDFLGQFSLPPAPRRVSVNADQEGRWYWTDLRMRDAVDSFGRIEVEAFPEAARIDLAMIRNVRSLTLDLPAVGLSPANGAFTIGWEINDGAPADLILEGIVHRPEVVLRGGEPFSAWEYDGQRGRLLMHGTEGGIYRILFELAAAPEEAGHDRRGLRAWIDWGGCVRYDLDVAGPLGWRLFDAAGRVRLARPATWTAEGVSEVPLRPALPRGVYFLVLERPGRPDVRLKVPVIR
jgi:hypothetical protein